MATISPQTAFLVEPSGDAKISDYTLGYVTETARDEIFDHIVSACVEAGVNKATLAKRLGKDPAQITRTLQAPANWTIDTIAEMMFAIDGRLFRADSYWPLRAALANHRHAHCLIEDETLSSNKTGTFVLKAEGLDFSPRASSSPAPVNTLKWSTR
jgi:hypothetical protein